MTRDQASEDGEESEQGQNHHRREHEDGRLRVIGAMLREKHRSDAAGLALAYQNEELPTFLASDLENIGIDVVDLPKQYEIHVLPLTGNFAPRPPDDKASTIAPTPRRGSWFLRIFAPCALT